jgi:nucleoside-diphosphate-sugar epimerase
MPVAFVTGGTGFVGLNLIEQLLSQNWKFIALHRPGSNLKHLREKDLQLVAGSITEHDALITIFPEKVDAVFHVAGNTNFSPSSIVKSFPACRQRLKLSFM